MESISTKVEKLTTLNLSHDVPLTTSEPISLVYHSNLDSNFADATAFSLGLSKFWGEAATIRRINEIIHEGINVHRSTLYTWRSLNAPMLTLTESTENKDEISDTIVDILAKEMEKLFDFYKFVKASQTEFLSIVEQQSKPDPQHEGTSDGVLSGLGQMLDMFSVLDDLRGGKTSVKNDLAAYKRIKSLSRNKLLDPQLAEMVTNVSMFLAQSNEIMNFLRKGIETQPNSFKIIANIINYSCDYLENRYFISPQQRYVAFRTILAALYLLANDKNLVSKMEQNKIPLVRIDKILRELLTYPIIGDMYSNAVVFLRRLNINFDWKLLDPTFHGRVKSTLSITTCLDAFEDEHISILTEFTLLLNNVAVRDSVEGIHGIQPSHADIIYAFALKALKLISKWNYALQDMFFYKLSHPISESSLSPEQLPVDSYSLSTKYNYDSYEKSVISRIIYFIKSLSDLLRTKEALFINAISMHIYNRWQDFANSTLLSIFKKSEKSKNQFFKTILWSIRLIACDRVDFLDTKNKKDPKLTIRSRSVSPLSSQIYLVTTMVAALLTMKDIKKHIDNTHQQQIQNFLAESVFFQPLSDFSSINHECAQMSPFWFKEFHIEMAAGRHIQYPIEDSFVWIITEHMIQSNEPNVHEFLLRTTSIYDDAAQYALVKLQRCHLFDEIDAEAKLVYDQFCFLVSNRLFTLARSEAFSCLIDKSLKNNIIRKLYNFDKSLTGENTIQYHTAHQISSLCKQRSIHYLGRSIDLKALTSQRLLVSLRSSIESTLTYMESCGLEYIVLVNALLEVYEHTHRILSKNYDLPTFQIILNEANGFLPGYMSRIANHVINCIRADVTSNYSYSILTNRFIKSPISYSGSNKAEAPKPSKDVYPTKLIANAYEDIYSVYSKYIGVEHLQVIFKLLGYAGTTHLVEEIKKDLFALADNELQDCTSVILKGMPIKCLLPRAAYGFVGALQYFNANFEGLLKYPDLRGGILHCFRIFGNYLLFVYLLEKAVYSAEAKSIYLTSPFNGIVSCNFPSNEQNLSDKVFSLLDFYKYVNIDSLPIQSTDDAFRLMIRKANVLNQEKLCCGLSFFSAVLESLSEKFKAPFWIGPEPSNGVVSIEECTDFHSVFSAINYCSSVSDSNSETPVEYEFGDGIQFAGLSIIHILNQYNRYEALDFNTHVVMIAEVESGFQPVVLLSTSGTMKSSTSRKTMRLSGEVNKVELQPEHKSILSRMKNQIDKRHLIRHILSSNYSRRSAPAAEVVKCFHPPVFQPPL